MKLIEKIRYQVSIKSIFDYLNINEGFLGYFCPFCDDKNGTLILKETENRFKCTKCLKEGNSIDIVKQVKNIGTDEAVLLIAEQFNIEEDSEIEDNILNSWKNDAESNKPSINDFFGISDEENNVDDITLYNDIFSSSKENETTLSYLQLKGFNEKLIEDLSIMTLVKPNVFYESFSEKYSKSNIDKAGLLDRNREFLFQKHKVIIPFFNYLDNNLEFIAGWDLSNKKYEFNFPHKKTIPNYFPDLFKEKEQLFIVEDFRGVFAFLRNGFNAIAIFDEISEELLEIMKAKKIYVCGEKNEKGNKFNRKIIKTLTENNIDFGLNDYSPCFEDYGDYLMEKRK